MNVALADRRLGSTWIIVVTLVGAILLLLAASMAGMVHDLHAQNKKPGREVVRAVKPEYPAIVKNARIGGTVRMNAIVLPNGTVSRVQIVGGNPILADSAVKAVMKWRYAPASTQTSEEVVVNFNSNELP